MIPEGELRPTLYQKADHHIISEDFFNEKRAEFVMKRTDFSFILKRADVSYSKERIFSSPHQDGLCGKRGLYFSRFSLQRLSNSSDIVCLVVVIHPIFAVRVVKLFHAQLT